MTADRQDKDLSGKDRLAQAVDQTSRALARARTSPFRSPPPAAQGSPDSPPSSRVPAAPVPTAAVSGSPGPKGSVDALPQSLAQDAVELQHPVLQRLGMRSDVGQAVRRNAVWGLGSRAGNQLVQFLGLIITARLLLPSDYGKAAVVFPVLAFGSLLTTLGLATSVIHVRRVTERLLSTAFAVNLVAGMVLCGLTASLAAPLAQVFRIPDLAPLLALASLAFLFNLSIVHTALLERALRFKQIALAETGCNAAGIATTVAAALAGWGAASLVLAPIVNQAALTVVTWALVRWRPRALPDRRSLHELWQYSRGDTGFKVMNFWSRNADNLLLARFVPLAELGNYSRAYNLMKLPVGQMNTMMGRVLFPALTRLRDDRPRLGRGWLTAISTAGVATAPVTYGIAVSAPALVEVLFGERWLGMVPVLQVLALAALPQTLTAGVAGLLRATGNTDLLFRLGALTSVMSVTAMLIGLPWGTLGVAIAVAVKYHVEVYVSLRPCLAQLELRWLDLLRALRGLLLAVLALGAAGLLVRWALAGRPAWQVLVAQVLICAATYLTALWFTHRAVLLELWGMVARRRTPMPVG